MELLKTIFDFSVIKALLAREDFTVLYDSMHGVQGPYAKVCVRVFFCFYPTTGYACLFRVQDPPCSSGPSLYFSLYLVCTIAVAVASRLRLPCACMDTRFWVVTATRHNGCNFVFLRGRRELWQMAEMRTRERERTPRCAGHLYNTARIHAGRLNKVLQPLYGCFMSHESAHSFLYLSLSLSLSTFSEL